MYDYLYTPPATEWLYPLAVVDWQCRQAGTEAPVGAQVYGCSFKVGDKCFMLLPRVGPGGTSRYMQNAIREHENGHCNGWGRDHAGAR